MTKSRGRWYNSIDTIVAGTTAYLTVEQLDNFGHIIPTKDAKDIYNFTIYILYDPLAISKLSLDVTCDENIDGNVAIKFHPTRTGQFLLHVGGEGGSIIGSPFPFSVAAGISFVAYPKFASTHLLQSH